MLVLGIIIGAVSVIGISKTVHAVSTDGYGRIPERTYTPPFSIR
ncbi:hypothetical protein [Aeromicrobium wangtongii]|nr:hypothetical protein [Aeromicrobium wangtongii]